MAAITIPSWLNINPTEPVGQMLHGYGLGLQASEAQAANAARAQQQQLAQQQAAELNAYRQQEQAFNEKKFTEELRLQQEKAQREAQSAALQFEGQRGAQADLDAGMEWPKVLAKWAPKLFAGDPRGLALGMQGVQKMEPAKPPVYDTSPEGVPFYRDPQTGKISFIPAASLKAMTPGGALTPTVTGKLQTSLLQGEKAVELGKELYDKLKPEDVGAKGVYNRVVINEGLAQLFPGLAKNDVADVQGLLGNFNEKAVAAITAAGDKRVSNADMVRYQRMLPKPTAGESVQSARDKINTFIDELRRESTKDAARLGQPRPLWTMSKDEVRQAYRAGQFGPVGSREALDKAAAIIDRYFPRGE